MPSPYYEGPRLKLKRAKRHLQELERTVSHYIASHRYPFMFKVDTKRQELAITACITQDGYRFAVIIADVVHNLRTALDQLAVALARMEGRGPSDTFFPTADSREKFETDSIHKIKKAGPEIVRLFRRLQPYKGGRLEAIWGLNKLDVLDKHRLLIPNVAIPKVADFRFRAGGKIFHVRGGDFKPDYPFSTAIIHWDVGNTPNVQFEKNIEATLDVCFHDVQVFEGQSVVPTLHNLCQLTERVFELVARFYTRTLERKEAAKNVVGA
jgi:hypothetical protein